MGRGRWRGGGRRRAPLCPRSINVCVTFSQAAPATSLADCKCSPARRLPVPRKLLAGSLPTGHTATHDSSSQNWRNPLPTSCTRPPTATAAGGRAGGPETRSLPHPLPHRDLEEGAGTGGKPGCLRKRRVPLLLPAFAALTLCQLWRSKNPSGS